MGEGLRARSEAIGAALATGSCFGDILFSRVLGPGRQLGKQKVNPPLITGLSGGPVGTEEAGLRPW